MVNRLNVLLTFLCLLLMSAANAQDAESDVHPRHIGIPVVYRSINDIAISTFENGQPVIQVNRAQYVMLPKLMQEFWIQHELGHHVLGHVRTAVDAAALGCYISDSDSRQKEREADAFAVRSLIAQGYGNFAKELSQLVGMEAGVSANHPLPIERAKQVLAIAKNVLASLEDGDPKAENDLELVDAENKFDTNAYHPIVKYGFKYKNNGKRTIKCTILIASGHIPRKRLPGNKLDWDRWLPFHTKSETFILSPGETHTVSGTLIWFRTLETMPIMRYPFPGDEETKNFICCKYIGTSASDTDSEDEGKQ